jgi:hypothetical protein
MSDIRQVFTTPDGKTFDTKAAAQDHMRRPKIEAALLVATGKNKELTSWLLDNQEKVEMAFEVGTIRRVSKSEHGKLAKSLEELKKLPHNPKLSFLVDNADAVLESFRWPSVKRMKDEEKLVAARNSLVAASEGNEELADWIIKNKDAVLASYEAGVEKRTLNPKAAEGLAAYRAAKAAEKAAEKAAAEQAA